MSVYEAGRVWLALPAAAESGFAKLLVGHLPWGDPWDFQQRLEWDEPAGDPDVVDVEDLLAARWRQGWSDFDPEACFRFTTPERRFEPFKAEFPGLAPSRVVGSDGHFETALGQLYNLFLCFVRCDRQADALWGAAWYGAVERLLEPDTLTAILRSWEERLGTYLVAASGKSLLLVMERPPASPLEAMPIAAEILAVAPSHINGVPLEKCTPGEISLGVCYGSWTLKFEQ